MKVRITKLASVDNPEFPTPSMEGYKCGKDNGNLSLPAEYYAEGYLISRIEIGKSIRMERHNRNGVECLGIFETSPVVAMEEKEGQIFVETANSKYQIDHI